MILSIIRIICISMTRMLIFGVRFENKNLLQVVPNPSLKISALCDCFIHPKNELAIPDCIIHGKQRRLEDICYQTSWTNSTNSNRKKLGAKKSSLICTVAWEFRPNMTFSTRQWRSVPKTKISTRPPASWKCKRLEKISHAGESPVCQHCSSECHLFWS